MKTTHFLVLLLVSLALAFIWFRHGYIMGYAESGLPFYDLSRMLEISKYSWADPALGNSIGIGVAAIPTYWALSQLQSLGIPGYFIQGLLFAIIFSVAGLSVYLLIKEIFPSFKSQYVFLVVFFYWFNPFSLVNVWNRFLYNYMFFWALLPLAAYLYLKGIKEKKIVYSVIVSLVCGIFSYALTFVTFNLILWGVFTYTSVFYLFFSKTKSERIFIISYFFATLASFLLINFWWVSQLLATIISPQMEVLVEFFATEGNLSILHTLSSLLGRITDTARLMHGTFAVNSGLWWAKIYNIWPVSVLLFVPTVIVFWAIYKFRKTKEVLFLGILFVLALFLMKGNNPPFGEVFQFLFVKLQPLQVFRNPFEKFGFLLPLVFAPLLSFGLHELSQKYSRFEKWLNFSIWFIVVGVMGFPFWTGLVFTNSEGENGRIQSYEVKVPDYYKDVNDWLNKQPGQFRFISLPLDGESITYTWAKPYSGIELSSALFEIPNISFNTTIPYYDQIVNQMEKYQLDENILRFALFTNTKYIVLRKDIDFIKRRMANPEVVEKKLNEWVEKGLIAKKYESGQLSVYEISDQLFWPKIYITPNLFISNSTDLAEVSKIGSNFPEEKLAILDSRRTFGKINIDGDLILAPEKIISLQQVLNLQNFSNEDLMAKLFYVKHLPDKWFYPLLRIKELFLTPSKNDFSGWILYKTGILGKRAVEVYKLRSVGGKEKTIVRSESDYLKNLSELSAVLFDMTKGSGPVSQVVKESLLYQSELLKRVNSSSYPKLSDLLLELKIRPTFDLPVTEGSKYLIYDFEVPEAGKYRLIFDRAIKNIDLYIDGLYEKGIIEPIDLNKGFHEVALLDSGSEMSLTIINKESLRLNETSKQSWNIDLLSTAAIYKIEFDYRYNEGKTLNIQFTQDIDNSKSPVFLSQVIKDDFFHGWRHWEGEINTSVGAGSAVLEILPFPKKICNKIWWIKNNCWYESQKFDVEINNFKVSKLLPPDVQLATGDSYNDKTDTTVDFMKINPTRYEVRVGKKNNVPEMLVFSELFDSKWKASFENGEKIPDERHFVVNIFANGWFIDKSGNYKVVLQFSPQSLLKKGEVVSSASVVVVFILFGVYIWTKRRH